MEKEKLHTWETVPSNGTYVMRRLRVEGGWIYYASATSGHVGIFVPDAGKGYTT